MYSSDQKHEEREVVIPELTVLFLKNAAPVERKIICTAELSTSPNMQPFEMLVVISHPVHGYPRSVELKLDLVVDT